MNFTRTVCHLSKLNSQWLLPPPEPGREKAIIALVESHHTWLEVPASAWVHTYTPQSLGEVPHAVGWHTLSCRGNQGEGFKTSLGTAVQRCFGRLGSTFLLLFLTSRLLRAHVQYSVNNNRKCFQSNQSPWSTLTHFSNCWQIQINAYLLIQAALTRNTVKFMGNSSGPSQGEWNYYYY